VTFRVWAPDAEAAAVTGDFGPQPIPLDAEDGGTFGATVAAARAGQAYRFILQSGGNAVERLDPRARAVDGGAGVVIDPGAYTFASAPFTMPSKTSSVIYELHVGSFGGDAAAGSPGTFTTVAGHLDWLQALGVSAIELLPSNHFGGQGGWGYNPDAYFAPHAAYGTPDDLRALVDQAHARGIGVILDVVYNHYDSSSKAPLHCFEAACASTSDNGLYFFSDPTYASTPWGPRPDFSNTGVADFVVDGARAWFTEYRADGLRWDSTANLRAVNGKGTVPGGAEVLARSNDAVHAVRPDALLVAEDFQGDALVTTATKAAGLGFDAQWDGFSSVVAAVTASSDGARDINAVSAALTSSYAGDPFARVFYTETHDTVGNGGSRLPDQIDSANPMSLAARKLTLLADTALLTAPAVPMLFMGEEMLATGTFAQTPAPLDWSLATTNAPIVAFYRDAVALRRNLGGTTAGLSGAHVSVHHVNEGAKVIGYRRWDAAADDVVILLNFGATAYASYLLGLPAAGPWHVRLNTDDRKYSSDFGGSSSADVATQATARDGLPFTGSIALGSYAAVVLSR
jgi:1,4-alpha-glucan branching enzyme